MSSLHRLAIYNHEEFKDKSLTVSESQCEVISSQFLENTSVDWVSRKLIETHRKEALSETEAHHWCNNFNDENWWVEGYRLPLRISDEFLNKTGHGQRALLRLLLKVRAIK